MNGLVAIGSPPTPQPVNATSLMGTGVVSTQACPQARLPTTMVPAPATPPAFRSSRLLIRLDDIAVSFRRARSARPGEGAVHLQCHLRNAAIAGLCTRLLVRE